MNLVKPKNLRPGDTIEIIAPSGGVEYDEIIKTKEYFESKGYKIKFGKNLFKADRYLAGSDEERIEDLHNAFLAKDTDAILCARGGYGAIRLTDKIDYNIIKGNPKIFCGYSDITALSLLFFKYTGLITFSGPMAQSDFNTLTPSETTSKSFFKVLSGNYEEYTSTTIVKQGKADGIIWGGNLSTIVSLCGLDFIPDEKFIFFLEDINEPVYKIDKMLHQLINIPKFRNNVAAIAYGNFGEIDDINWLIKLEEEVATILNIPAASGFMFSHNENKQTIPIGIQAQFDGFINIK